MRIGSFAAHSAVGSFPAPTLVGTVRAPLVSSATWDADHKNAHATLAGLTATSDGGNFAAGRATSLLVAGSRYYWETRIDVAGGINRAGVGFCTASQTFGDGAFLGIQTHGAGYYNGTGEVYYDNNNILDFPAFAAGAVVGQVFDRIDGLWWTTLDGETWSDGVDVSIFGDVYPAFCVRLGGQVTLIPGPTFTFTPPAGCIALP